MGFFDWLFGLLFGGPKASADRSRPVARPPGPPSPPSGGRRLRPRPHARLVPFRYQPAKVPRQDGEIESKTPPYRYARYGSRSGRYLDLSRDVRDDRLARYGLPRLSTPDDLARWLDIPTSRLAWLIHRCQGSRPASDRKSHYHYYWTRKRSGGWRLIESPKSQLKQVQRRILTEILDRIPLHDAAHGFRRSRNIVTNARPHVGKAVVLKFDLQNFYPSVSFNRCVAIFRSLGFSREVSIWLGMLTTSALPTNTGFPKGDAYAIIPYLPRHLPQGAPTSPALANLSAYSLDLRLSGLAASFGGVYTRYADDLTFSGDEKFRSRLRTFIPLVQSVIRRERFGVNHAKRKVLRPNQTQYVTGVVVNRRVNCSRRQYDRLKAILTNCVRHGAASQNRDEDPDFRVAMQGRIAHLRQLNPARGAKLQTIFDRVDWRDGAGPSR